MVTHPEEQDKIKREKLTMDPSKDTPRLKPII